MSGIKTTMRILDDYKIFKVDAVWGAGANTSRETKYIVCESYAELLRHHPENVNTFYHIEMLYKEDGLRVIYSEKYENKKESIG